VVRLETKIVIEEHPRDVHDQRTLMRSEHACTDRARVLRGSLRTDFIDTRGTHRDRYRTGVVIHGAALQKGVLTLAIRSDDLPPSALPHNEGGNLYTAPPPAMQERHNRTLPGLCRHDQPEFLRRSDRAKQDGAGALLLQEVNGADHAPPDRRYHLKPEVPK